MPARRRLPDRGEEATAAAGQRLSHERGPEGSGGAVMYTAVPPGERGHTRLHGRTAPPCLRPHRQPRQKRRQQNAPSKRLIGHRHPEQAGQGRATVGTGGRVVINLTA